MSSAETGSRSLDERLALLSEACRVLHMEGHGNKTLGHMSLRDPDGRGAWIKRAGIALGEVRRPDDFVLVAEDGKVLAGDGARSAEWPVHMEIYRARPEIHAVAHTYPFHASVIGTTGTDIEPLTREGGYFRGRLPRYRVTSNLITTPALGRGLAEALARDYAVLLHNHGMAFCGRSIAECVVIGVMLRRVFQAQFIANASGLDCTPSRPDDQVRVSGGIIPERDIVRFWNYCRRKLARAARGGVAGSAAHSRHAG